MITTTTCGCSIDYIGSKEDLIAAGIVTADQFPTGKQHRLAKFRAYPPGRAKNAAGGLEWVVFRNPDGFTVRYEHSYLEFSPYSEREQVF